MESERGVYIAEIGFLDERFQTDFRCVIEAPHRPWWGEFLKPFVDLVSYWSYRRLDESKGAEPSNSATAYVILRKPKRE